MKLLHILKKAGEFYKSQIIKDLPEDEEISIYKQGDWLDLCRSTHIYQVRNISELHLN